MSIGIGSTVTDKYGLSLGVVLRESKIHADRFIVRAWAAQTVAYTEFPILKDVLIEIKDPKVLRTVNEDDRYTLKQYQDMAVDMALFTNDEAWFKEVVKMIPREIEF